MATQKSSKSSIIDAEIEKFKKLSDKWWNGSGEFKALHEINIPRIQYIKEVVQKHFNIHQEDKLFEGLDILDVGCGGGLLSEPLARLGGNVTGIDAVEENILIAQMHAQQNNLKINYFCQPIEEHIKAAKKYDVIVCMEVVEHVDNVSEFIQNCCMSVKQGGIILFSTINRTIKSYLLAIVGAEYLLRWVPVGTHDWNRFLKPSEINNFLLSSNFKLQETKGIKLNPLGGQKWVLSNDIDVNYVLYAKQQ
jgi:2-polyprenyl-6-hydroxyphenyl methylase/3-demethylubiquinone-9 3-methyltransferase